MSPACVNACPREQLFSSYAGTPWNLLRLSNVVGTPGQTSEQSVDRKHFKMKLYIIIGFSICLQLVLKAKTENSTVVMETKSAIYFTSTSETGRNIFFYFCFWAFFLKKI